MSYRVEDVFECLLPKTHRLYDGKKHPVIIFSVPVGDIENFPLKNGSRLVTANGEEFEVKGFDWFNSSSVPVPATYKGIGVVVDRPMKKNEQVSIKNDVDTTRNSV